MPLTPAEIRFFLSRDDLARLASYAHNLVDYHMFLDQLAEMGRPYFDRGLGGVSLSALQETILIGQGLQHKTVDELMVEFPKVDASQVLALFNRSIRKMQKFLEVNMPWFWQVGGDGRRGGRRGTCAATETGGGGGEDAAGGH